jgi:hypothetical protein
VVGERPADLHLRLDVPTPAPPHPEADPSVVQQDGVSHATVTGERGEGHRDDPWAPHHTWPCGEQHRIAGLELDTTLGEGAQAELGALEILKDCDVAPGPARFPPDSRRTGAVVGGATVREVEAGDVHPGSDHAREHARDVGGGAKGADDLRAARHGTDPVAQTAP